MPGHIAVIGAGTMGAEVAYTIARAGQRVVLVDKSAQALTEATTRIINAGRLDRLIQPKGTEDPLDRVLEQIKLTVVLEEMAGANITIENVTEDIGVKRSVYEQLSEVCQPPGIVAANTSAIPITLLASFFVDASRVVGVHFMNPVPLKPAVELVRGVHTSDDTVATTVAFLQTVGKRSIPVKDSPGFVSNRVLMLAINEAAFLLYEGVATAEDVDRVFRECIGYPMGPLSTADLIGLDTVLQSLEVLLTQFADTKYRPCPLLKQMVNAGFAGRKARRGFFEYP